MLATLLKRLRHSAHAMAQESGPPDLEQLWRDFNQRLARIFGGKPPGPPDDGAYRAPPGGGAGTAIVAVVGGIIVLIWLASGAFIVQTGQTAVVTTFGKVSHTAGAGFNWRWPYPFQDSETVNVSQVRTVEVGFRGAARSKKPEESLMLTDDENIVDIQFAVQYKIKDPVAWLFNNKDLGEAGMREIAETAVREIVGKNKMDFILYENREQVATEVRTLMQGIHDRYSSGVLITNVTMQNVQPPEQVQAAFDDAVKAGQDRERSKNDGAAYANKVVPTAKGDAARLLQDAEAHRASVTENAIGNAARFNQILTEYQKAPGVTRDRMYLETMQSIFASTSKVLVDSKSNNNMLYLPLDKLIAKSAENAAASPAPAAAPAAPAEQMQTVESVRGREARGRDREGR